MSFLLLSADDESRISVVFNPLTDTGHWHDTTICSRVGHQWKKRRPNRPNRPSSSDGINQCRSGMCPVSRSRQNETNESTRTWFHFLLRLRAIGIAIRTGITAVIYFRPSSCVWVQLEDEKRSAKQRRDCTISQADWMTNRLSIFFSRIIRMKAEGRKEAWREDASGENYSQKVGVWLGEEKRKNNQKITRRRDFPQFLSVDDDWWCLWVNRSSWTLSNTSTQALFHSLWPTAWLSKSDVWIFEWKTREN